MKIKNKTKPNHKYRKEAMTTTPEKKSYNDLLQPPRLVSQRRLTLEEDEKLNRLMKLEQLELCKQLQFPTLERQHHITFDEEQTIIYQLE